MYCLSRNRSFAIINNIFLFKAGKEADNTIVSFQVKTFYSKRSNDSVSQLNR